MRRPIAQPAPTPAAVILLATAVAAGGCAEILGLDDPAGRLEGTGATGSTGAEATSTGTDSGGGGGPGQGGGPGAGGGSSTGSSTSSGTGSSTGAGGGGAIEPGVLALPEGFVVQAIGRSDQGAVALVRWTQAGGGSLCGGDVPEGRLAAVAIDGPSCEVLATIASPSPTGIMVEQRGPWLGLVAQAFQPGTVTVNTTAPVLTAEAAVGDAGIYGLWNVETPASGFLRSTTVPLINGHVAPRADGSTLLVQNALRFGFEPPLVESGPCESASEDDAVPNVHIADHAFLAPTCSRPRASLPGTLLDAGTGDATWALVMDADCVALRVDDDTTPARSFGSCEPFAHLHVHAEGDDDLLFLGSSSVGLCSEEVPTAGLVIDVEGQTVPLWCDDGVSTTRVIPFLADATHVHFVREIVTGAELWKVPLDGGAPAPPRPVCGSCSVRDAIASDGTVYLIGYTSGPTDVLGMPIDGASELWAWLPVDDL